MRIIDLTFKDILQVVRDKRSLLFLVAMPVAFTLFMGFAYRSGENGEPQDPRMSLAWVEDAPGGALSQMLYTRLEESDTLKPVYMEKDAAHESLERGEVDGVLVIPSEFGEQAQAGEVPQVTLIADTTSTKGQSLYQLLRVPISQLMSAVEIGQVSAEILGSSAEFTPALELAWKKWDVNNARILVRMEQAVA
ncbi:MAG: ABC transporter permease, partial [Anaerolineales bacterium]|nr:ABC transporter permease [Anaerolineales bacterium]